MYWVTGVLGLALAASPFIFGYSDNFVALWSSLFIAGAVLITSVESAIDTKGKWEYWLTGAIGVVAVAAPFLFSFGGLTVATWASIAIGAMLTVLAATKLYYDRPVHY